MDKFVFIGGIIPVDDDISRNTKNFMNSAADAFQTQFIEGLRQNGVELNVLSAPFIGPYPLSYKKAYFKAKNYLDGYRYVSFNNIWGVRNHFRFRSLVRELRKEEYRSVDKFIVYSVHTPFAQVAKYLKKRNPNAKICLITPDLPEYMNLRDNKSLLYTIAKKGDSKLFYSLTEYFDCFCFVSVFQSDKVNKRNKPQTIIEAMAKDVEVHFAPPANAKKRIVYTGSLNKRFGIMHLVEAVEGMGEGVELILCGTGDALSEVEAMESKKVRYLGVLNRASVRQIQLSADVLVNPRTNEGEYTKYSFPSKTMEYLGTGRPVVCHKLDGIPVEYDQYLIYPPDESVEALRSTLESVLALDKQDLERIFLKNTSFLRNSKSPATMTRKILAMFDSL